MIRNNSQSTLLLPIEGEIFYGRINELRLSLDTKVMFKVRFVNNFYNIGDMWLV